MVGAKLTGDVRLVSVKKKPTKEASRIGDENSRAAKPDEQKEEEAAERKNRWIDKGEPGCGNEPRDEPQRKSDNAAADKRIVDLESERRAVWTA